MVITRAGRLREWAVVSDHALKQYRLTTYEMYETNVQVTHPQRLKIYIIQMITNNAMSHKYVAQQVVSYESFKQRKRPVGNSQKWSRSLLDAGSGRLRELLITEFE